MESIEDLKDLRQPFKKLDKSEVSIEIKTVVTSDDVSNESKEFNTNVYERPKIIPNFINKSNI